LRNDGDALALAEGLERRHTEHQRHAIDIVDRAQAVGSLQRHTGTPRDRRDFFLRAPALLIDFAKAAGENDHSANVLLGAATYRVGTVHLRNGEHRAVDSVRQLGYRARASALADAVVARIHQVQRLVEAESSEVREHAGAERPRCRRCADDRHTTWAQKSTDRHALLRSFVTRQARTEALVVEELRQTLGAPALRIVELRFG